MRCGNGLGKYRGNKAVSAARKRFDVERSVGVIAERCPDLVDALVHPVLEVNKCFPNPELLLNFVTGHDLPSVTGKQGQELKGLWGQLDDDARLGQLLRFEIQLEDTEAEQFLCGVHKNHLELA